MSLAMGSVNLDRKKIHSFFFFLFFPTFKSQNYFKRFILSEKVGLFLLLNFTNLDLLRQFFFMKIEDICCASISRFV